ncbi:uncharacterized protein LOC142574591 [Dermacentor variabilis]|uniref:uncharacterized protein LOC142574591 n=1 Tax=Dermacentor variabilis TaxID=34621 RepID=UPI003F5B8310
MDIAHAVKVDAEPEPTQNRETKVIMAHQLPDFEEGKDKWKPYLIKVGAYFEANAIEDSTKKRALLVAALNTHTIQVLAGKVAPRNPNALTYEEVVEVLIEHYSPKRHEITESYKFFSRCQAEGEPVNEFLVDIRRIADNCNFGSALDRMLRDRIVCGMRAGALQKQLLAQRELTLQDAEAMALAAEAADRRLPVLGELALQVCHKGVTVKCALTVLDCAGPSLCGRDLIQRLNSAGAPVVSFLENSAATNDSSESSVNSIFNDYNDVFSEELGLIKGPPASLHMKEGAVPKFCKARPIPYALRERVSLELDRLVSVGVLSPVAHSEWATPIVVVLKKDGAAERNYSQLEREALALVFGVTKLRDYLLGREFTLVTDHQPLLGLLKSDKQTPTMAAARIQRWALHLGAYRYRLQYAPGRQMLNADALSRLPQRSSESDDDGEPPEYVLSLNQLNNGTITTRPKEDQDDWLPLPASELYTRNYGVGSKWTPGHVKATSGARMVTVETSDGVIQRHVDQVRPRQEVPGVKPTVTTTTTHRSEPDQATQLQHPETVNPDEGITARRIPNGTRSPDFAAPDIPVAPLHTGVAQQTLRSSTREHKPVQRFHF